MTRSTRWVASGSCRVAHSSASHGCSAPGLRKYTTRRVYRKKAHPTWPSTGSGLPCPLSCTIFVSRACRKQFVAVLSMLGQAGVRPAVGIVPSAHVARLLPAGSRNHKHHQNTFAARNLRDRTCSGLAFFSYLYKMGNQNSIGHGLVASPNFHTHRLIWYGYLSGWSGCSGPTRAGFLDVWIGSALYVSRICVFWCVYSLFSSSQTTRYQCKERHLATR